MPNLKIIDGTPLDFSSNTNNSGLFSKCDVLEEVRVAEGTIKISISVNLPSASAETIQSFFDGLSDLSGGTAQTITLLSTCKILQSQVDSANAKGWTVAGGVVVSEEEYYG